MENILSLIVGSTLWITQILGTVIIASFLFYFYKNNKKGFRILLICLLTTIFGLLLLSIIPNFMRMPRHPYKEGNVTGNMHTLQLVLEDFYKAAENKYPSNLFVTIGEVNKKQSDTFYSVRSIAAINGDTIFKNQIGLKGQSLLPKWFINSYDDSKPIIICTKSDPPVWDKEYIGTIYFVPYGIKGNVADGFKIYGAGNKRMLKRILESNQSDTAGFKQVIKLKESA